jgi:hypothetical protein
MNALRPALVLFVCGLAASLLGFQPIAGIGDGVSGSCEAIAEDHQESSGSLTTGVWSVGVGGLALPIFLFEFQGVPRIGGSCH